MGVARRFKVMRTKGRIIHWFRRDLRITDNTSLYHASKEGLEVIPVYVLSEWKVKHPWTGANRQQFLCGCLESLSRNLEQVGSKLVIRSGSPVDELIKLARETRAEAIYFNENYSPFDRRVEAQLQVAARINGIEIRGFKDTVILAPIDVLSRSGKPFRVFTPYARAWYQQKKPDPLPKIARIQTSGSVISETMPTLEYWELKPAAEILDAGEKAARLRLKNFLNRVIFEYSEKRNRLSLPATSRLSQDLRFGTISPREVYSACLKAALDCSARERQSINGFVNELIWREFYFQILWHFPKVLDEDFNETFSQMRWDDDSAKLKRWCEGTTGFPIVDAGMRELNATGFMHNRARMIVAMFLTKDLHIHWRKGEQYFMQKLVDGDIPANNGGWQWSAGTGADAAPYFRIQNPWTQTKSYDPHGDYIKKWIPELNDVDPIRFTNAPGEKLAPGYPLPIVNHAQERAIALERFNDAIVASRTGKTSRCLTC